MSLTVESTSFNLQYPIIKEFINTQLEKCYWTANEVKVEKDIHDVLVNLTPAERHGVFTTLKLFTLYEVRAGGDYWTGMFMNEFKQHECQEMAAAFGMVELCIHKPFYNKINELLNISNAEFYTDYVNNPVLKARMECIDKIIAHGSNLVSLGAFSLVEGVILYSNFAFLKHFQSLGKNKLLNVVRGINFSVRDENLHSIAGAWVYNQLKKEVEVKPEYMGYIEGTIKEIAQTIYEHECAIIDMIFEKGEIEGITSESMKGFVGDRINMCLAHLNIHPILPDSNSSINDWFYAGINNFQFNDFFTGQGREYTRDWNEQGFIWK